MTTLKPLAAIVRSSDGVAERRADGTYHADDEQVEEIARYARELRRDVAFMAPEPDVSGGKPIEKRPSLREAIEGVERGEYGGVIVAYLSRLTRSRSGLAIWGRVEAAGGHVYTARERLDTSTPNGRLQRDILLAVAVNEREEHAERHAKRRRKTCEAGMWRVRQLPRGYRFAGPPNADGKFKGQARRLAIEPVGAGQVRRAAADVCAGVPVVRIARELGMTPSGVRQMLRNRVYLGELKDGAVVKEGAHEAVLAVDVFDAVQGALDATPRPARGRHDGPALLAGIVACSGCDKAMSRAASKVTVYRCAEHHSGAVCPAPASITCSLLDEYVERIARERFATVRLLGEGADEVGGADARLAAARAELQALVKTITAAGLGESDVIGELRARKASVTAAERDLQGARSRSLGPRAIPGDGFYDSLSPEGRNAALRGLLDRVVVRRSGRGGRPPVGDRVEVVFHV